MRASYDAANLRSSLGLRSRRKVIRKGLPGAGAVSREVAPIERNYVQEAQALAYGDE